MIVSSFACQEVTNSLAYLQSTGHYCGLYNYTTTLHHLFGYLTIDAMISQPHVNDLHDTLGHLHNKLLL